MTDREERLINERVAAAVEHWPTLTEAFGCLDCGFLFRRAKKDGVKHGCPLCTSTSIIDVARHFNNTIHEAEQRSEDGGIPSAADPDARASREAGSEGESSGQ